MAKKKVVRKKVKKKLDPLVAAVKGAERREIGGVALKLDGPEGHASSAWCTPSDSGGRFT